MTDPGGGAEAGAAGGPGSQRDARTAELAGNLVALRRRIDAACVAAGRPAGSVTLVAVTKTFPAADIRRLAALGVTDIGENRDQEARAKAAELVGLADLRWHFVGRLQRNKVNHVVGYADVVHSVDRPELVSALAAAAARVRSRPLDVLVQVSLDPDQDQDQDPDQDQEPEPGAAALAGAASGPAARGGARPGDVPALADQVAATDSLRLAGLMAVAPLGADPEPAFARLAQVAALLRAEHPDAVMLSAGMSADLEAAIRHGATHVRVGTALLGGRTGPVG